MATDVLTRLREAFLDRCREDLERIRTLRPDDPELGPLAHRLAGAAGSFGYPALSEAAAVVDEAARNGVPPQPGDIAVLIRALETATGSPAR